MTLKLGVVMDPIADINYKKDSTLAMLWAAAARDWQLFYMEQQDLYLEQGLARASMAPLNVFHDPHSWYALGEREDRDLAGLDAILMRKDPPFDNEFIYTTYILEEAERRGTLVVNRCESLRDCNEKVFATRFPGLGWVESHSGVRWLPPPVSPRLHFFATHSTIDWVLRLSGHAISPRGKESLDSSNNG